MKIVILPSAEADLRWYRRYYANVFPEGQLKGRSRYVATTRLLQKNPFAGQPMENAPARKLSITGTPFQFIYRVVGNQIQVVQIRDGRSNAALPFEPTEETQDK